MLLRARLLPTRHILVDAGPQFGLLSGSKVDEAAQTATQALQGLHNLINFGFDYHMQAPQWLGTICPETSNCYSPMSAAELNL